MICFKCGRQGHKEDACVLDKQVPQEVSPQEPKNDSYIDYQDRTYASWMLVKKPVRRNMAAVRHREPGPEDQQMENQEPPG